MFPKHLRVTVRDFRNNPSQSTRYSWSHGAIQIKPSLCEYPRIAIVTPKRIDKRSSHRHQSRRFLVEMIRPLIPQLVGKPEMQITLSRLINTENRDILQKELIRLLQQKGLLPQKIELS